MLDDREEKTGCWKLKQGAVCGEPALEEAVDLSEERLQKE